MENSGPQIFVFNGTNATQLKFDGNTDIYCIQVDKDDNIWCLGNSSAYAVYNGDKWFTDYTTFKNASLFCIEQAPNNKIWIGTGDGIYINE
jgi:hypothetical protein